MCFHLANDVAMYTRSFLWFISCKRVQWKVLNKQLLQVHEWALWWSTKQYQSSLRIHRFTNASYTASHNNVSLDHFFLIFFPLQQPVRDSLTSGLLYSRNDVCIEDPKNAGLVAFGRRSIRRIPAAMFLSSSFSPFDTLVDNTDMANSITIPSACDFHLHVRQDEMMRMVTPKVPEGGVSVAYIMVMFLHQIRQKRWSTHSWTKYKI